MRRLAASSKHAVCFPGSVDEGVNNGAGQSQCAQRQGPAPALWWTSWPDPLYYLAVGRFYHTGQLLNRAQDVCPPKVRLHPETHASEHTCTCCTVSKPSLALFSWTALSRSRSLS